ncbi:hypothetical protein [Leptospira haakeii]|uniref:Uncharacterized protein n=1 Tax=Leptospira haakeii TaxID=2023198 RepID=A0ABX4PM81_9LEPT|nr:hypothetical protein [Leptospira haakeii]PKA16148.1 hypothetical protein CH363_08365 [Leptospira haakeii]PKA18447.1 hypothetical protein CH377_17250 [Leptospira haakeii]
MKKNVKKIHIEATTKDFKNPGANPVSKGMNIAISLPESIEIRMVNAAALADYEVWFLIASILASTTAGFLTAYIQEISKYSNLVSTIVFGLLFLLSIGMALSKRKLLTEKSKTIKVKMVEAIESETD